MPTAPFPTITAEHPNARAARLHLPKNSVQAATLQTGIVNLFVTFEQAFHQTHELPLKHGIADTMTRLAATWRTIDEHRREILGKPRAGSLSPAERAAMRQRKSSRAPRAAPRLAPKESLSAAAPSPRVAPAGGAADGKGGSGVPSCSGSPAAAVEGPTVQPVGVKLEG